MSSLAVYKNYLLCVFVSVCKRRRCLLMTRKSGSGHTRISGTGGSALFDTKSSEHPNVFVYSDQCLCCARICRVCFCQPPIRLLDCV